jgi:hypothetical protein
MMPNRGRSQAARRWRYLRCLLEVRVSWLNINLLRRVKSLDLASVLDNHQTPIAPHDRDSRGLRLEAERRRRAFDSIPEMVRMALSEDPKS